MLGQAPPSTREGLAARFKEGRELEYLVHKDVTDRRLMRLGVPITTISHYRLASSEGPVYYTFYTTADRRVAFLEPSSY